MTTLGELLKNVDKSEENEEWVCTEYLGYELGIDGEYHENHNIKMYWVYKWMCTDTSVGGIAIYLNDELVGFSRQSSRKGDTLYSWVSTGTRNTLREYLLSLSTEEDDNIDVIEMNYEWGDGYNISHPDAAMHKKFAVLEGVERELYIKRTPVEGRLFNKCELTFKSTDKPVTEEDLKDMIFPWHVG